MGRVGNIPRMATTFSMLGIINAALVSQGMYQVTENDGSVEWDVCATNWPMIVEAELEDGNYSFSRRETTLISRIPGKFGKEDGYLLPGDALHVRKVWLEGSSGDRDTPEWTQDGQAIYIDGTEGAIVEYIVVEEPDLWSALFSLGVQLKLESVISRSLKEEYGEAADLDDRAEQHFQRARTRSSHSRSPGPAYRRGVIAAARFGRGSR